MDAVLAKQIELVRRDHPEWDDEHVERVAKVWAERAKRMFWSGAQCRDPQPPENL